MSIFPEHLIDTVRQGLDAAAVLHKIDYRPEMIQDTGDTIKCFCPIHKETIFRTLLIDKAPATFRCSNYNCPGNAGGDLIELYARSRDLGYEQALLELASAFGISVDLSLADQYVANTLEVARNYVELGVLAEAEEAYDSILRFKNDSVPALEGMIRIYEQTDRQPEFHATRLRLARVLLAHGETEPATELLRQYARDNPHDTDARLVLIDALRQAGRLDWAAGEYVNLADDLSNRGDIDRALECYRAAQALNADGVDVSMHIVQLLVSAGRRDEAIAENLARMESHLAGGDPEGAIVAIEAALAMEPSREDLAVRLAETVAAARIGGEGFNHAAAAIERLLATRSHGPAAQALDALEAAFPGRPRLLGLRADLEAQRGNDDQALELRLQCVDMHQQRREFDSALAILDKTMQGRAPNVALLSRKANLLRETGAVAAAIPVYLEIVELFRQADEFEHAAAVYQTVIDLEPDKLEHRQLQFELYLMLGIEPIIVQKALALAEGFVGRNLYDDATRMLYRALQTIPHATELLVRQGEIFEAAGRRAEAAEQFLSAGRLLLDQQAYDRARQALEHALRCLPEHLEAREALADVLTAQDMTLQAMGIYNDLAEFYSREQNPEAIIRIARKILSIQPEHIPTLLMLARGYGHAGYTDKQLSTQSRLVQLYIQGQSFTRATEICEEILNVHDDYAPAIEQLVMIAENTKLSSQSVKYLFKLSQVHARGGRREQEQAILEQILQKDPQNAAAWYRHLELLMLWATPRALGAAIGKFLDLFEKAGHVDEAVQVLEDLRETSNPKPEVFGGLARLYRARGDFDGLKSALRTQGELLGKLLRDPEALEVWQQLAALLPDDLTVIRTRIEIMLRNAMNTELLDEYRKLAEVLARMGRPEEAENALREVLKLNPREAGARDQIITILIGAGDHERANDQIEEAAARAMEEGQPSEAIRLFERTFEFDPMRESVYRKIIAVRQRMGDVDGALEAYRRLLDIHEQRGELVEFEQVALDALKLRPEEDAIRMRLADLFQQQGRKPEAEHLLLAVLTRAIELAQLDEADKLVTRLQELNPDSLAVRAHRAELMARRGQTAEALSEFMSLAGSMSSSGGRGAALAGMAAPAALNVFRSGNYEGIALIKDYTFETFVVGTRNNFAHATALAVSRAPARNYNPLFLYSEVGLGKTHLCHAIAHYIRERHPDLKLLYTTTEDFVAELIDAIQTNSIAGFRARHKMTDVLLIDDVQFLSGKERAQEEFFNIFNSNYQAGKQIVLTSDRPPKDISHLEKRLKSRFGAGIIVDIQPPDLETRLAILKHELDSRGKAGVLADEILLFLAETVESNIRELKGALNQLIARQEVSGERISLDLVRQVLTRNYSEV